MMKKQRSKKKQAQTDAELIATIEERVDLLNNLVSYWCQITGRGGVNRRTITIVFGYLNKYGAERLLPWVDLAYGRTDGDDEDMGKYISGIIRNLTDEELNEY